MLRTLELPSAPGVAPTKAPRAVRLPFFLAREHLAAAVVAAEVLGPPLALRPGGTLGPPAAF